MGARHGFNQVQINASPACFGVFKLVLRSGGYPFPLAHIFFLLAPCVDTCPHGRMDSASALRGGGELPAASVLSIFAPSRPKPEGAVDKMPLADSRGSWLLWFPERGRSGWVALSVLETHIWLGCPYGKNDPNTGSVQKKTAIRLSRVFVVVSGEQGGGRSGYP